MIGASHIAHHPGTFVIDLQVNGQVLVNSPIFVRLLPPKCGQLEKPTDEGVCICQEDTTRAFGACRTNAILAIEVAAIVISGLLIVVALVAYCARRWSDSTWTIHSDDLVFSVPPSKTMA